MKKIIQWINFKMFTRTTRKAACNKYVIIGPSHYCYKLWRRILYMYIKTHPHRDEDQDKADPTYFLNVFITDLMQFISEDFQNYCNRAFKYIANKNKSLRCPSKWTHDNFDEVLEAGYAETKSKWTFLDDYSYILFIFQLTFTKADCVKWLKQFNMKHVKKMQREILDMAIQACSSQQKILMYLLLKKNFKIESQDLLNSYRNDCSQFEFVENVENMGSIEEVELFCLKLEDIVNKMKAAFCQIS